MDSLQAIQRNCNIPFAFWNVISDESDIHYLAALKEHRGLYFKGANKAGKTFTACGIANYFIQKKLEVFYTSLYSLSVGYTTQFNNIPEIFLSIYFLIIDEVKPHNVNSFLCLERVLKIRGEAGKKTIIISNGNLSDIPDMTPTIIGEVSKEYKTYVFQTAFKENEDG